MNIRLIISFLFLISVKTPLIGQKVAEFEITELNWSEWDVFHEDSARKMPYFYSFNSESIFDINFANQIKILDIDGIEPLDLVYYRSDSSGVDFFINLDNNLLPAMSTENMITEILRSLPLSPIQIKTANYDSIYQEYQVDLHTAIIEEGKLTYAIQRTEILQKGIMDIYGNMPPSKFKVITSTPLVVGPGLHQSIRKLSPGEIGYGVGSVETKPGEHWWKVYIQEEGYKWRVGWIRRANVERVYK